MVIQIKKEKKLFLLKFIQKMESLIKKIVIPIKEYSEDGELKREKKYLFLLKYIQKMKSLRRKNVYSN